MFPVAMLVCLASGTLMAAVGLALWGGLRRAAGLFRGAGAAGWVAVCLLVFGALLAWGSRLPALEPLASGADMTGPEGPVSSMILMAALAIPLEPNLRKRVHWSQSLGYLPALALSGTALGHMVRPGGIPLNSDWVTPIRFSLAVSAGLGGRALGRALQVIAAGTGDAERAAMVTYGMLTFICGSAALVNLWQRGTVWAGSDPVMQGGVVGAWLAWSAHKLASSWHPRLRSALTAIAALLLIVVAVKGA